MIRTWTEDKRRRGKGAILKMCRAAGRNGALIALSALMTQAAPIEGGAPFLMALTAAGLQAGAPWWAFLVGCAISSPYLPLGIESFTPLFGCGVTIGLHLLLLRTPFFAPDEQGEAKNRDVLAAITGCAGLLAQALPLVRAVPYDLAMAMINAALALAAAPAMVSAFLIGRGRTRLMGDERLSVVLVLMCALMGVYYLPAVGVGLAHLMLSVLVLLGAMCSVGAAAVCGVLGGGLLVLLGDPLYVGCTLALCALASGTVKKLGRPAMALAFAAVNALATVLTAQAQIFAINPYLALLAGLVMCFVPPQVEQRLVGWFAPAQGSADAERVVAHARRDAEKKTRALGLLFQEMSEGYDTPSPLPDEAALVAAMRAKLCDGCPAHEKCWSGASSTANRLLVELLSDALCGNVVDAKLTELPPDVCRKCRRANQIPKKLGPMLQEFDETRRAARERGECKQLLASQFALASEALLAESDHMARPLRMSQPLALQTLAALDREGLVAGQVWAVEDSVPQLFVALRDKLWSQSAKRTATRALGEAMGYPMKPSERFADGELCFTPAPVLSCDVGFAGRSGTKGTDSGDSHLACAIGDGKVLLALSDGMGSGKKAQTESESALRLLKRFLVAGAPATMALSAVNELLLLRSGDEMFATADVCMLDLCGCRAQFVKLGCCASVVLRRDKPILVEGGRLPLGVLQKVSPMEKTLRMQVGDLIVMVTDGVLDGSREGDMEWLLSMIRRYKDEPPQKLCERLVSLSAARGGGRKDDMTALVARVGEVV